MNFGVVSYQVRVPGRFLWMCINRGPGFCRNMLSYAFCFRSCYHLRSCCPAPSYLVASQIRSLSWWSRLTTRPPRRHKISQQIFISRYEYNNPTRTGSVEQNTFTSHLSSSPYFLSSCLHFVTQIRRHIEGISSLSPHCGACLLFYREKSSPFSFFLRPHASNRA